MFGECMFPHPWAIDQNFYFLVKSPPPLARTPPQGVYIDACRCINSLMKMMALKANINNERLTNHSARKHMIQKLNDNEIPPTHIMQLSGHKNVQSITNYSSLNVKQQKNISGILGQTSSQTQVTTSAIETATANNSKMPMSIVEGAVISGGQLMISINALTTSLTIQTGSSITETTKRK